MDELGGSAEWGPLMDPLPPCGGRDLPSENLGSGGWRLPVGFRSEFGKLVAPSWVASSHNAHHRRHNASHIMEGHLAESILHISLTVFMSPPHLSRPPQCIVCPLWVWGTRL